MSDNYVIAVQGLDALNGMAEVPAKIQMNAVRALNSTIDRARTGAARRIREQVDFPASYLAPSGGRLSVTKRAQSSDLEAVITGRHRPTSLARFAVGGGRTRKPGVRVQVKPGLATFLPKAFFINLRSGNTDTLGNRGLAIRLPAGKKPDRAYKPTPIGRGVWLLYGPAISQVFDDVAADIAPESTEYLEAEFLRLMDL